MSENVTATMNGTQSTSSCFNPTATRIGETFAYCLLFLVSLIGNTFIAMIVFKKKTLRKPINFLIVNMAMSDLLLSIFLFPDHLVLLYTNSWVIGGPLSQLLCKFTIYAPNVSFTVSVQSLVLIAVDRFGAVIFPLRSPLINSKRCRFYILATWIIAMAIWCPDLFAWKLSCRVSRGAVACVRAWLEWRIRRVFVLQKLHFGDASCICLCSFGIYRHSLLCHYVKNQIPENSRTAINSHKRKTIEKRAKGS